jgi:hypothetical protein
LGMTISDAKSLLASEAGVVRLMPLGPEHWYESPEAITCCWPVVEANGPFQTADLCDGITEQVSPDGWTAAVRFSTASGWTRHSAANWIAARLPDSTPRAALFR